MTNHRHRQIRKNSAFTLMEMVLVLAIISLLIGLSAFTMKNVMSDAKADKAMADIRSLETQLVRFSSKAGFLPTNEQGLKALVEMPSLPPKPKRWTQTMGADGLIDPYGNPYQYKKPGSKSGSEYDVFSMGADGQPNTADDIGNW